EVPLAGAPPGQARAVRETNRSGAGRGCVVPRPNRGREAKGTCVRQRRQGADPRGRRVERPEGWGGRVVGRPGARWLLRQPKDHAGQVKLTCGGEILVVWRLADASRTLVTDWLMTGTRVP